MTDLEFLSAAEDALQQIETICDCLNQQADVDIDTQRNGNMLTLTFANGSQIVVNLQKPLHEIWMAAKTGGFHYHFEAPQWIDTKNQGELFTQLSQCASEQAEQNITFQTQATKDKPKK